MRYSATWWTQSCSQATIVVVDGYTYYFCDDYWFSRTYYGGDVIYTVTDPPPGYCDRGLEHARAESQIRDWLR